MCRYHHALCPQPPRRVGFRPFGVGPRTGDEGCEQVTGFRIMARGAVATVCAVAAFGPLGVAWAQEDTDVPPDSTTTSTVAEEPPVTPPPTVPEQPPPTQPEQPPTTVGPTPTTSPPPTPTTPPPAPTTTNPPPTPTTNRPGTTPTTARPVTRAPVIVFPTKVDGAVSTSTSAPAATTEPKTAVKTVPGAPGTTTTSENPGEARVAGRTQERDNGIGNLAARTFDDSSSSLLPSSTLGAILLVALVGFLAAGTYCGWLLVFARR